jgi:hypothetical protein
MLDGDCSVLVTTSLDYSFNDPLLGDLNYKYLPKTVNDNSFIFKKFPSHTFTPGSLFNAEVQAILINKNQISNGNHNHRSMQVPPMGILKNIIKICISNVIRNNKYKKEIK